MHCLNRCFLDVMPYMGRLRRRVRSLCQQVEKQEACICDLHKLVTDHVFGIHSALDGLM